MGVIHPLDVSIDEDIFVANDPAELEEPLETQAEVPFSLSNDELGLQADFKLVMRFTEGMFSSPPQVNVKTIGEYPGTYYVLDEAQVGDYMP